MNLAVIPARGGSKGIPKKNIKLLFGKPLIAWSIEAAHKANCIDHVCVSTDCDEIAKVAELHGAEVIKRPNDISGDQATMLEMMQHVLSVKKCETFILLQATSPIRTEGLIDRCYLQFKEGNYDSLATGFDCKYIEYSKDVDLAADGKELQRQDIPGFFYDDGNVYCIKPEFILRGDRYGKSIGKYYTSKTEHLDIDDPFDFWMVEKVLEENKIIF